MRSWLFPPVPAPVRAVESQRAIEASPEQVMATGAAVSSWGRDPVDGDVGFRPAGSAGREVPWWTLEKARTYSTAAYRSNPMARAIIDTYVSFCVGDSGVTYQANNPQVRAVVDEFWTDPRNDLAGLQERFLRDHLIMGETGLEMLVGPQSGAVRFSPIPSSAVLDVAVRNRNPLWPSHLVMRQGSESPADDLRLPVVEIDDETGLRDGRAMWWASWQALLTDHRGTPFLMPVVDQLDAYDTVISNLIDRTALARYLVWDVTVEGGQTEVDNFVKARGGTHVPRSGSVEVHNSAVKWDAKHVQTGAYEDAVAAKTVLTQVASGTGLAKTWLAEPEDSNRATSLTMAEPVRRRVRGVQKLWLGYQTQLVRFAVDRAVAARRLAATVEAHDPKTGQAFQIPAAQSATVTGPEVAAADAQLTAQVLLNLSTGLEKLVKAKLLTPEAAAVAARKAWEDYVGVPYTAELSKPDANPDDVATAVDDAQKADRVRSLRPA